MVSPTAKWTAKSVSNSNGAAAKMAMRKRIAILIKSFWPDEYGSAYSFYEEKYADGF